MQKNTDPRGCPFGSILDNNTITEEKLEKTLKNTYKYRKMLKYTEEYWSPGLPIWLDAKYHYEFGKKKKTERYWKIPKNTEKYWS